MRAKRLAGIKNIDGKHKVQHASFIWTHISLILLESLCFVCNGAVYAMGLYIDSMAAKSELGKDFDCLPPISLERNQALAEREYPAACKAFFDSHF